MNNRNLDINFGEDIESQADQWLWKEAEYIARATPLKSAAMIKNEHRSQIIEYLKMTELHHALDASIEFIKSELPSLISAEAYQNIEHTIRQCGDIFTQFIKNLKSNKSQTQPTLLYQQCALSTENLQDIYKLVVHFVETENFEGAKAISTLLITLDPYVPEFWNALGVCLQNLKEYENAIDVFDIAKILNPNNPGPYIYAAECYLSIENQVKAAEEIEAAQPLLKEIPNGPWLNSLSYVNESLKKLSV